MQTKLNVVEQLESRRLLTDLGVWHDPSPDAAPGDEVTQVIRVFNRDGATQNNVVVDSKVSNILEDATWERSSGKANFLPGRVNTGSFIRSIATLPENAGQGLDPVGDLNGDGVEDYVLSGLTKVREIIFGSADSTVQRISLRVEDINGVLTRLGDVNDDGYDDLGFQDKILFGHPNLADRGALTLDTMGLGQIATIVGAEQLDGVGDINGDGIDDLASSDGIGVIGSSSGSFFAGNSNLSRSLSHAVEDLTTLRVVDRFNFASSAGDLNHDGFDDAVLTRWNGHSILFGGPDINATPQVPLGRFGLAIDHWVRETPTRGRSFPAGDVNGDGVDDILLSYAGGGVIGTQSDKGDIKVTGGAVVVFGAPGAKSSQDFKSVKYTLQTMDRYRFPRMYMAGNRARATAIDVDGDGLSDITLSADGATYTIFGNPNMSDTDLGFADTRPEFERYLGFNGEDGYGQTGRFDRVDFNGDGIPEEVWHSIGERSTSLSIYEGVREHTSERVTGTGNINEVLSLKGGESAVYTITGRRVDDGKELESLVYARGSSEGFAGFRDNSIPERSALDLSISIEGPESVKVGERADFTVNIQNHGPASATDVVMRNSLISSLGDVSITSSEGDEFQREYRLDRLFPDAGVSFTGPETINQDNGVGSPPFPRASRLGQALEVTSTELIAYYTSTRSRDKTTAMAFSLDEIARGVMEPSRTLTKPYPSASDAQSIDGDFDNDGLVDTFAWNDPSNASITFGNGKESKITGFNQELDRQYFQDIEPTLSLTTGDLNGDGITDLAFGEYLPYEPSFEARIGDYRPPMAYVIFGGETIQDAEISVEGLDGKNGFRLEADRTPCFFCPSKYLHLLSGVDLNGDGVDDLVIGDTGGGEEVSTGRYYGSVYVFFGRKAALEKQGESLAISLPSNAQLSITISGVALNRSGPSLSASASLELTDSQFDFRPSTNSAELLVSVEPSHNADINQNGVIGFGDFLIISRNFGNSNASFEEGDLDGNGLIDFDDFMLFAQNFGLQAPE